MNAVDRTTLRPAAFIDRDGTLIVEHGFLDDPKAVSPLPGAVAAIQRLNAAERWVIGVTNQSGVARGYFGADVVRTVNQRVIDVFAEHRATIHAIYYCPHYPALDKRECDCRKPRRGMVDQACRDFAIDLTRSVTIGDRACDVLLGQMIGVPGILVLTGYGREELARWSEGTRPDYIANHLGNAIDWWGTQRLAG